MHRLERPRHCNHPGISPYSRHEGVDGYGLRFAFLLADMRFLRFDGWT